MSPNTGWTRDAALARWYKRLFRSFHYTKFILADPSAEMLNNAKRKLASDPANRVQFLEPISTQDLPKNVASPEVITAIQSHHYISRKERIKATNVCFDLPQEKRGLRNLRKYPPTHRRKASQSAKKTGATSSFQKEETRQRFKKHMERFDVEYHPITIRNIFPS